MGYTEEKIKKQIIKNMPEKFYDILQSRDFSDLREIRFRTGQKIMLYYGDDLVLCGNELSAKEVFAVFESFCKSSVYAYLNEIKNGFITIVGGHRIGICGECVVENGEITNIHNISGLNIRIAREYIGSASKLFPYIIRGGDVANTIIIAPPACGKTTMLRDISRHLSQNMKITVIDERDELCSLYNGQPQFDIGFQADVLSRAPKSLGMLMALRSLSPDVIITDEVGTQEDILAIEQVLGAGCKIITSIHGYSVSTIKQSKERLLSLFDIAIELKKENGIPTLWKVVEIGESYG